MLIRILAFLLETIFFVLIAAALLRAWMNWVRVNMSAQPGRFVMALTDWLVKPLRRALPRSLAQSRVDWASVIAAVVLALVYALLWALLFGLWLGALELAPAVLLTLLSFALKMLVRVALQTLFILVLGFAILSWVQPGSPLVGPARLAGLHSAGPPDRARAGAAAPGDPRHRRCRHLGAGADRAAADRLDGPGLVV